MEEENFEEALIEFAERVEKLSNIRPADVDLVGFLENFQEFDSNFDQLSLAKTLKDCLANEITLDSAIATNQNRIEAIKKFQKSPKFVKFKQKTCDLLVENVSKLAGPIPPNSFRQRAASDFNGTDLMNSSSYSWMSSSPYGQSTLFVGKNVLKRCLAILESTLDDSELDLKMKRDVLHELSTMRSSDIVAESEHWEQLKNVLVDLLNHDEIFSDVLRFIVKLFNCQTHTIVVDVYEIILRNLGEFTQNIGRKMFLIDDGLNIDHRTIFVYLSKFRLFLSLISSFPSFWTRYSDELITRIVQKTFQFLSASVENCAETVLNPLLSMALFDLDGKWFQFLMFSTFSRSRSIAAMKQDERFFTFILGHFLNLVDDARTVDEKNSKSSSWTLPSFYQSVQLKSLLWSQCCRTLTTIVQYDDARKILFPIKIDENLVDFQSFFHRYLAFWLSGTVKNPIDVKFMSTAVLKMSSYVKNNPIFISSNAVQTLVDGLSSSTQDERTTILTIFNEIFVRPMNFRAIFAYDLKADLKSTKLGKFLVDYCSNVVNLAWQKDPDAPLNLVYAAVNLCATLCRFTDGRKMIASCQFLIPDVVRLAKDKTLPTDCVFPLLTSCDRRQDVKKYLHNSFNFSSRQRYVWSTPFDYPCGNLVQKFVEYLRIVANSQKTVASAMPTPFGLIADETSTATYDHEIDSIMSKLYIFLAQPSALRELSTNQTFVDLVDASFAADADENSSVFVLNLIRMILFNLNFLLAFRRRVDYGNKLKSLLEKNFVTDDREFQINRRSLILLEIYLRQNLLAGPSERPTTFGLDSTPIDVGVLFDSNNFRAEPSCFFISKPSLSIDVGIGDGDFLAFFVNAVESKQRISHCDLLLQYFSSATDANSCLTRSGIGGDRCGVADSGWNMILEYGENLKIFDDLRKSTIELKNVHRFLNGKYADLKLDMTTEDAVDWLAGMAFLMTNGRSTKTIQFLSSLITDADTTSVLWPTTSDNFRDRVVDDVTPMVERLCELACPTILSCLYRNGVALSNLLFIWLNQSFINFLDYPEIINFISLSILGGRRHVIFFCCCLLKHLSSTAAVNFHSRNLPVFLSNGYNFHLHNYISDLKRFREIYDGF